MITLGNLKPNKKKVQRKRKGQGNATGNGTYGGRGMNGQNARSGGGVRLGFEGGQSTFWQKMPKKPGFNNPNRVETVELSLTDLENAFEAGADVNMVTLLEKSLIPARSEKIKILGNGEITKKLVLEGILTTKSAKAMIEKAGGEVK